MSIEIKTSNLAPIRNTFAHIERRFGDKPANRYQEATYDVQSEHYFHYRPLWQPDKQLNDATRTAIVMKDWYDFKDPRQFYYGVYVQQRAKMQENAENNYTFFENRNLADNLTDDLREVVIKYLLPIRHCEQSANINNVYACAYGFGTAITQAFLYNGMDRLAIAQYISRIGLLLDNNTGASLIEAKRYWMEDSHWQEMRRYCEETTIITDWFETFIAQNVISDGLVFDIFYESLDQYFLDQSAADISLLTEFMRQWRKDSERWVDAVLKIAVSESEENKLLIETWVRSWLHKAKLALKPLIYDLLDASCLDIAEQKLLKRLQKAGIKAEV